MVVCKFGGSSVADEKQIMKVKAILENNIDRRIAIVSAPGKRNKEEYYVRFFSKKLVSTFMCNFDYTYFFIGYNL